MQQEILANIRRLESERARVIVAIDGPGGAGKSSLARELVKVFGPSSLHIEFDWFYLPVALQNKDERYDTERFIKQVLTPFRNGADCLQFEKYNWGYLADKEERLEPDSLALEGVTILVVEGSHTLCRGAFDSFDLRIYIDMDPEKAHRRGVHRDIEEYGLDSARVYEVWRQWKEWEERSLQLDDRRKYADIII